MGRRRFLFLEPFFGGSHRNFAEGLIAHSAHDFDLLTMPAIFWKWRLRGAALYFADKIDDITRYDGIVASDLMSMADFKALMGPDCPPVLVYFHESQFFYPLAPGEKRDFQYGFTDITTALAADRVLFNSHTHMDAFFYHLPRFLRMMPDRRPRWVMAAIKAKSDVLYPGCRFGMRAKEETPDPAGAPLIVWNHRWEFDKNPEDFFAALDRLVERNIRFRLALLGESARTKPTLFLSAKNRYGDRLVHYGYVASRSDYIAWLRRGAVMVSTALQENFGIATVEAVRHGCIPLLPDRLSYPEIIPEAYHSACLYRDQDDLVEKLSRRLTDYPGCRKRFTALFESMDRFSWENMIRYYDAELDRLSHAGSAIAH